MLQLDNSAVMKFKRTKSVKKLPVTIHLPKKFIAQNEIVQGDVLEMYILMSGELVIKKRSKE